MVPPLGGLWRSILCKSKIHLLFSWLQTRRCPPKPSSRSGGPRKQIGLHHHARCSNINGRFHIPMQRKQLEIQPHSDWALELNQESHPHWLRDPLSSGVPPRLTAPIAPTYPGLPIADISEPELGSSMRQGGGLRHAIWNTLTNACRRSLANATHPCNPSSENCDTTSHPMHLTCGALRTLVRICPGHVKPRRCAQP